MSLIDRAAIAASVFATNHPGHSNQKIHGRHKRAALSSSDTDAIMGGFTTGALSSSKGKYIFDGDSAPSLVAVKTAAVKKGYGAFISRDGLHIAKAGKSMIAHRNARTVESRNPAEGGTTKIQQSVIQFIFGR